MKMSYHMGPLKKFALYSYPKQYSYKIIQKYVFFFTQIVHTTQLGLGLSYQVWMHYLHFSVSPPPPRWPKSSAWFSLFIHDRNTLLNCLFLEILAWLLVLRPYLPNKNNINNKKNQKTRIGSLSMPHITW